MADWADGSTMTTTELATFIPELWSDEIVAAYKVNFVMRENVIIFNHKGKRGDTIHIPAPLRGAASAKSAGATVTLIQDTPLEKTVTLNLHYEYSRHIEDIAAVQGLPSMREFFVDDAGEALAAEKDTQLLALLANVQGGTAYSGAVIGGDGSTAWSATNSGNGSQLTDPGIRRMGRTLDDANIPQRSRVLAVPPIEKESLLGMPRYTEQAFIGNGDAIWTGLLGLIYGAAVYCSTNLATIESADSTDYRVGGYFHRSAFALVEQLSVRVQTQYEQRYLSDLFTADEIYGVTELRDNAAIAFIVPAQ